MKYIDMLDKENLVSKPIKLQPTSQSNIFKTNINLIISYLTYKFINMEKSTKYVEDFIYKPDEVINETKSEIIHIGSYACKIFNEDKIYTAFYPKDTNKILSKNMFTSLIVFGYDVVSTIFVKSKIRFISKDFSYIAFESVHSPEILVSLREIIDVLGVTNDTLYLKRETKAINLSKVSKSEDEENK